MQENHIIKEYAPVIIITLDRFYHFRRCVESLKENSIAKHTELYISVDYPPEKKYEEGYSKIKKYIEQGIEGFQEVHVYFQEHNLGPIGNYEFVSNIVRKRHSIYISTEDDNIFSKNYLEYMNWGLDYFRENESIVGITGFSQPVVWKSHSPIQYLTNEFNGWGYGSWFCKEDQAREYINNGQLSKKIRNLHELLRIVKYRPDFIPVIYRYFFNINSPLAINKKIRPIDISYTMYLIVLGKKIIMPTVTKVNNEGYDGSGVNCTNMGYEQNELDESENWIVDEKKIGDNSKENIKIIRQFFVNQKIKSIKKRMIKSKGSTSLLQTK